MNWELVSVSDNERLERTAVDGGWIYRYQQRSGSAHTGYSWATSICFVPNPAEPIGDTGGDDGKPGHGPKC